MVYSSAKDIMLAFIGFLLTGFMITAFAASYDRYVATPYKLGTWRFSAAYYCLGAAFLLWALAAVNNTHSGLVISVLAGDGLLLAATFLLASLITPVRHQPYLFMTGIIATMLLVAFRAVSYAPTPYIKDGILFLNSPDSIRIIIAVVFLLLWLPINVKMADLVTKAVKLKSVTQMYASMYTAAILAAVIFLFAQRESVIILSFIMVGVAFAVLTGSNYAVHKIRVTRHQHGK